MTDPKPPTDELLAQDELRRQAAARLPEIVASTTGVALDRRRLVQATTTASGELRGLALHPAAMSFGGTELGRMIIEAAQQATEFAKQRCFNELALVLGDTATAELEALLGPSPARAAGWDTARTAPTAVRLTGTDAAGTDPADTDRLASVTDDIDPDDPLSFDPSSLRSDR
jgi:hypothetical protein